MPARVRWTLDDHQVFDLVMHEYDAIRNEINTSLAAQISILSFGAATVGLLVAASGAVWSDEPVLAGLLLLLVVPTACFLTLAIHAGEMVRLMRAGLFLNHLENCINDVPWTPGLRKDGEGILLWEQWDIRQGPQDMGKHNEQAVRWVFVVLGVGFMLAGSWRLYETLGEIPAIAALTLVLLPGAQGLRWVRRLQSFAYKHRRGYCQTASPPT